MRNDNDKFAQLRIRAETLLNRHGLDAGGDENPRDIHRLLHEIEVHAVELKLQNEELQHTRDQLESTRNKYRDLYDFAPVAYLTLSDNGMITDANVAATQLLGLPAARVIDRGFFAFVAEQDRKLILHAMRSASNSGDAKRIELRLLNSGGPQVHVRVDVTASRNTVDGKLEYRLVVTDISESKLLEQQRDMFFSIASHELRTPITNIALSLDLILQTETDRLPEDIREKLKIAQRGTKRLRRLMEDILGLRSIQTGNLPLVVRPLDLSPLVKEAVGFNTAFAEQHDVRLYYEPWDSQALVNGNEARLFQVLNNLLTNAIKNSPPNGLVTIRLCRQDGMYRIIVEDQGTGVPESLGQRIFEPFTQGKPSLEDPRHKESKGLGLSIGREIVERLGGQLNYANQADSGARFFFDLPVHQP